MSPLLVPDAYLRLGNAEYHGDSDVISHLLILKVEPFFIFHSLTGGLCGWCVGDDKLGPMAPAPWAVRGQSHAACCAFCLRVSQSAQLSAPLTSEDTGALGFPLPCVCCQHKESRPSCSAPMVSFRGAQCVPQERGTDLCSEVRG